MRTTLKKKSKKKRKETPQQDNELEYVGSMEPDQHLENETQEDADVDNAEAEVTEKGANDENTEDDNIEPVDSSASKKRKRGPTKMKHIAKDPNARERVDFTDLGEPCGPGSVKLLSYLGTLVREHVPVIIETWKKIGEELKTVLWKSVQARFELDEWYQKVSVLKQMGCLWRASKSRLVKQIRDAENNEKRMQLRPKNVPPNEWRKFVKLKTSPAFKAVSDKYKERRSKQIPHTTSRKGMARLAEDMKKDSPDPSKVTRPNVWVKSRTKKDGTPVSTSAAEKIQMASEIDSDAAPSSSANPKDDHLSQILGPDNPGRMRAMGRGISMTKLACYQVKNNTISQMQADQVKLKQEVKDLQDALRSKMSTNQRQEADQVGENSAQRSVNAKLQPKCVLFDWTGAGEIIAEGRLFSSDRDDFVNDIPLGPNSVKVLVESATKPDAFLWRPAINMSTIEEAVGEMIAWPASNCVLSDQGLEDEDIAAKSPGTDYMNKCKLMDWAVNDETVVAEGWWLSKEKQALVNGLPLGPSAVKVFVDDVLEPHIFLWRPTASMRNLEHSLKSYVAWPLNRVVFETPTDSYADQKSTASPSSPIRKSTTSPLSPVRKSPRNNPDKVAKENQKCKLMAISGKKRVVVEGRWASNNPDQVVHFVPLGPNAVRVWVDTVKDKDAKVWRPCSEIECMDDAIGTSIAWPEDKVVLF